MAGHHGWIAALLIFAGSALADAPNAADGGVAATKETPQLLGAGMSMPKIACEPSHPTAPLDAEGNPIEGLVLVAYTVYSDGHVGDIILKNPTAPPALFHCVEEWLVSCRFSPSVMAGNSFAVRLTKPFSFHIGKRVEN
jgi:hypothetical protein